jgi:glycosyltransferase involved in cell wall biosynthesis
MSRICFLSNHIYPFHVGGSEMVIKNISEQLVSFGHDVLVSGWDVKHDMVREKVSIKTLNINKLKSVLENNDVIIVYSDAFLHLDQLLRLNDVYRKKVILFPVGFTAAKSNAYIHKIILDRSEKIKFVCHDNVYVDAKMLEEYKLPYSIIPNGISGLEFNTSKAKSYSNNILRLLCVANAFPKKGHAELFAVCDLLSKELPMELNIYCHTPSWDVGKRLQSQLVSYGKSRPYSVKFNIDKPREEVVKAFYDNDLFLFCSLKEVAPLCIIESCAAGTPWISFNVGNVSNVPGGLVNDYSARDQNGYIIPSPELFRKQLLLIKDAIVPDNYSTLSAQGIEFAKSSTWERIAVEYDAVIKN